MARSALLAAACLALQFACSAHAASAPQNATGNAATWWMSSIKRQGSVPYTNNRESYQVFRNVAEFNAKGDGSTDDTEAINEAISSGGRCGLGCNSSTTTPAIIYFPPGVYSISDSIIPYYYTHLIGDARNPPTIKVRGDFKKPFVIDADPYGADGKTWWRSRDNFFRQIRNFKIDLTDADGKNITGIHWPVAQATSLQNIEFNMAKHTNESAVQQGLFIEDGSGGFMTDLVFNGGKYGMNVGSQQFTSRNLTFNGCQTAINMLWNWLWTFHGVTISNSEVGINMANRDGTTQTPSVGSVLLLDSTISNTKVGIATLYDPNESATNGTLVLDNVDMSSNVEAAVKREDTVVFDGNRRIETWTQGRSYTGVAGETVRGPRKVASKPDALKDDNGKVVTKSKPQYEDVPSSQFVSVKSRGAKGDGVTDDTEAIRQVFHCLKAGEIVYFDYGAYLVTDTIKVPKDVKIVGEVWPLIMAGGNKNFKDQANPKPVFQIGQQGETGNVEIQDLMFATVGPQPGAILVEFNVAGETKGSAGLFDVHFRVGGANGTDLQLDKCQKKPNSRDVNMDCVGAFMLMHVTPSASPYLENIWMWVADHEFDAYDPMVHPDDVQLTIYNGRGILIESTKGAWLWGTASEHNVMSNYQLNNAENVYMAFIQSETAYYQGNPDSQQPFKPNSKYADPDFSTCAANSPRCARTWGMRVNNSTGVFVYGSGLYSFFDNYDQECLKTNNCQDNMIAVDQSKVELFGISTKASANMVTLDGKPAVMDADNRNTFCGTIASFES
ncbi:pectate lyase superfamily protein [Hirsutella rhossiliensis]|uniref:Pectate lyase superfamily protein n=1 Tax=Hirsutella rhossiliensis TaxID=111463 RepID=A0A9P8MYH9_9HYPO|nr:pectate lyase superfamily protein [Hirsutella rhossiliensis]KAH0962699.1 pectate lyase superfamily protein [Hirsutella rhossiliensis]